MEINGFEIVGVLPVVLGERIERYVILGKRSSDGECVTAIVWSLDATSWNWGNYFHGEHALSEAYRDMHQRAGTFSISA